MHKKLILLCMFISAFGLTSCNDLDDVSFADTNQRPISQTAGIDIFTVKLEEDTISLGDTKVSEINGWIIENPTIIGEGSQKVPVSFNIADSYSQYSDADIRVALVSEGKEDIQANDAVVYSFYADFSAGINEGKTAEEMKIPDVSIAENITWGSTYSDVINTLGEPSSKTNVLDEHTLSYYYPEGQLVIKINSDGNYNGYGVYSVNVVKTVE